MEEASGENPVTLLLNDGRVLATYGGKGIIQFCMEKQELDWEEQVIKLLRFPIVIPTYLPRAVEAKNTNLVNILMKRVAFN